MNGHINYILYYLIDRQYNICFGRIETHIMRGLKKPPYSSSKAWGRSQWKRVTNGCTPTIVDI